MDTSRASSERTGRSSSVQPRGQADRSSSTGSREGERTSRSVTRRLSPVVHLYRSDAVGTTMTTTPTTKITTGSGERRREQYSPGERRSWGSGESASSLSFLVPRTSTPTQRPRTEQERGRTKEKRSIQETPMEAKRQLRIWEDATREANRGFERAR